MVGKQITGWRTPALLVTAFLLLGTAALLAAGGEQPTPGPLPFDPLSETEQQQAIDLVLEDPLAASALSERHQVIGAALNTDKHRLQRDATARQADVWVYDYERDATLEAQVDLRADLLVDLSVTTAYQPPITATEIHRASDMVLADPRVQDELETQEPYEELETIVRLWTGDAPTSCPVNRCALVGFVIDGDYTGELFVRVNLSQDRVEELIHAGDDHHGPVKEGSH